MIGAIQMGAGSAAADTLDAAVADDQGPGPQAAPAPLPFALPDFVQNLLPPQEQIQEQLSQFGELGQQVQAFLDQANPIKMNTVQPVSGTLTSNFGSRWGTHHGGIDIAAPIGTPVLSASDGVVIDAGPAAGFGQWVRVQHDDGTITVYGHIDEYYVGVGQRVAAGETIAAVGNKGQSTGPHLHFEVHDTEGFKVDPKSWLQERGVAVTWNDATVFA